MAKPVAIVTGASRRQALGAAVARELAERGYDIAFTHWRPYDDQMEYGDPDGPAGLRAELEAIGARVADAAVDFLADDAVAKVFACADELGGPISVLINNAAYSTTQDWVDLTTEEFDRHLRVNSLMSSLLSMEFARRYGGGPGGRIISLTSGQSLGPMPTELAYAASKGAIEAFVRSFSVAVGPLGITVNSVNPGPNDTGWMTDELKQILLPKFALGRIGTPPDVAKVVGFLCSEDGGWITGQVINIEGGFTRS
jgi:3-oxoacyl-[acyl-carrier protein] reductase